MVIRREYVPKWRPILPLMYFNNYKYGTGLYNGTLCDLESRYKDSLSKALLDAELRDIAFGALTGSSLMGRLRPLYDVAAFAPPPKQRQITDYNLYAPIPNLYPKMQSFRKKAVKKK